MLVEGSLAEEGPALPQLEGNHHARLKAKLIADLNGQRNLSLGGDGALHGRSLGPLPLPGQELARPRDAGPLLRRSRDRSQGRKDEEARRETGVQKEGRRVRPDSEEGPQGQGYLVHGYKFRPVLTSRPATPARP